MFSVEIIVINTTWHISHQTFVLMKTPWRCLSSSSSEDVFKTSWSWGIYSPYSYVFRWRLDQDQYIRLGHTSSRHFPQVFKMSSRHLQDVSKMFQDVLKTSSGHLQDFFKTSSRHLQDVLQRCLQDAFKTYYQVKLFLLHNFKMSSRLIQNISEKYC